MHRERFHNQDLTLPQSWEEITIGQYTKCRDVLESDMAPTAKILRMLSTVSGVKELSLRAATGPQIDQWWEMVKFVLTDPPEPRPAHDFSFEGEMFTLATDLLRASAGELVDADTAIHQSKSILHALPQLVAIYARPEGEEYDSDVSDTRIELFSRLPVVIANDLAAFFLASLQGSGRTIQLYGVEKIQMVQTIHTIRHSARTTDGMQRLFRWPVTMFCKYLLSSLRKQEKSLASSLRSATN